MESAQRSFGQIHFGNVSLGDLRRNRRLPQLVDAMVRHPGGTLPEKFSRSADLDAFYHLCSVDDVTHAAVLGAPVACQALQLPWPEPYAVLALASVAHC